MNAGVSLDRQSEYPYAIARLRRGALLFVASKGLTAPLNLVTFFLIAARRPTDQFALYAWLIAVGQLSHQLSFLGLNWAALHYVPLYRSRIGGPAYRRSLLVLVALRVIVVTALVAAWTIANMQDPSGYFYSRRYPFMVARTPMPHWGQATMYRALAYLSLRQRVDG